ncbi:hypothetical protein LDL36_16835 [Komagataeibacter sp. FNDCR1]|nr:hypothetical protein [Komagataeibacter sp. FNDCR1]
MRTFQKTPAAPGHDASAGHDAIPFRRASRTDNRVGTHACTHTGIRRRALLRSGVTNNQFAVMLFGAAVFFLASLNIYQSSLESQMAEDAIDEMNIAITALYSEYGGQNVDMEDVSLSDVTKGGLVPSKWLGHNGMTVTTPFDTALKIAPSVSYTDKDDIVIEMSRIPRRACLQLAQTAFGPQILDVTSVSGVHSVPGPMTPEEAERACPDPVNLLWWGVSLGQPVGMTIPVPPPEGDGTSAQGEADSSQASGPDMGGPDVVVEDNGAPGSGE